MLDLSAKAKFYEILLNDLSLFLAEAYYEISITISLGFLETEPKLFCLEFLFPPFVLYFESLIFSWVLLGLRMVERVLLSWFIISLNNPTKLFYLGILTCFY